MDDKCVEMLGPFAKAISCNLSQTDVDVNDLKDNNIFNLFSPSFYQLGNFCNSFLLFSCNSMSQN